MESTYTFTNLFLEQTELNTRDNLPDGFYDDLFHTGNYESIEDAKRANDFVTVSTATNEEGMLGYHLKRHPSEKEKFICFDNQDPRFGEDYIDNQNMLREVVELLEEEN